MDSILTSIKKRLGLTEEYEPYDDDIITEINTAFATLNQMGVGPSEGFSIQDSTAVWTDYISNKPILLAFAKDYIKLKVKLKFDTPTSSIANESIKDSLKEMEFRMQVEVEKINNNEVNNNDPE